VNEVGDLPTELILRLDILPEEVALKYGYGLQRKVVNIILRRRFVAQVTDLVGGESTQPRSRIAATAPNVCASTLTRPARTA
jgi:hypothetical protein